MNIGYQAVTGIDERDSVRKFTALLAKLLAVVVRSLLRGSNRYNSGRLVCEGLGISVLRVLENIEENIVGNIVQAATALNRWHFVGRLFRIQTACQQGVLPTTDNRAD